MYIIRALKFENRFFPAFEGFMSMWALGFRVLGCWVLDIGFRLYKSN